MPTLEKIMAGGARLRRQAKGAAPAMDTAFSDYSVRATS
jgi:hypothetical protein